MPDVETFRSAVAPSDCDVLGHMNVSRYFAACSDGVFSFQTMLGLGIGDIRGGRKLSFAVVHAESDFLSEIHAGEVIYLKTGIERIVFRHRLYKAESGTLAFETKFQCVMLDLDARKGAEIPADVRRKAQDYLVDADD